jgi:hypothetical protein
MKLENKLEGASNFRAWKTRIDLILAKNKVLDTIMEKFKDNEYHSGLYKIPLDTLHISS